MISQLKICFYYNKGIKPLGKTSAGCYNKIKNSEDVNMDFSKLVKVNLHMYGSVLPETLLELAQQQKIMPPADTLQR